MRDRLAALYAWGSRLGQDFGRTRASLAAGGLAYFVALSLAPAALAFGTLAGFVLDPTDLRVALERLAERAPGGSGGAQPIIDALVSTVETASASTFTITAVVSLLIAVYAASKVLYGLRLALNSVYGVPEVRSGLVERGISAVVTLVGMLAAVLLVAVLTILPRLLDWLGATDVRFSTGSWLADWLIAGALVFVVVRWILAHASNERRRVRWTSFGPWVATLGIGAATIGVGIYTRFSTSLSAAVLVFGTAIVILLWLYLCFLALLWGAIIEVDGDRQTAGIRTRTTSADRPPAR